MGSGAGRIETHSAGRRAVLKFQKAEPVRYGGHVPQAVVKNRSFEYEVHGDPAGVPLLLVMGLGGQMTSWPTDFIEMLVDRGFRVVRFDNRDSGLSWKGSMVPMKQSRQLLATVSPRFVNSEYRLTDMAADAVGILDHLGIDAAHVVGMSMGAMIAQTVAIEHPRRVLSLTSVMSTTGNRRVGTIAPRVLPKMARLTKRNPSTYVERQCELFRTISGSSHDPVESRRRIEFDFQRSYCPDGTGRQLAAIMASPDRTDDLGRLRVPALVVHGMQDTLVQPSGGMATARAIPGARLLMFNDMGHDLPKSRRAEIADAIADLADTADTAGVKRAAGQGPALQSVGG